MALFVLVGLSDSEQYGLYGTYARNAPFRDQYVLPIWETITLQDYRNRHNTYVAFDEGLRNLRQRAPMMVSSWDDHEGANDNWAGGAENNQETCSATPFSTKEEKQEAKCDRDEGDMRSRHRHAATAYYEWMPMRYASQVSGVVNLSAVTRTLEWGDLATFTAVESRMTERTRAGGLGMFAILSDTFTLFEILDLTALFQMYGIPHTLFVHTHKAIAELPYILFALTHPFAGRYDKFGFARFFLSGVVARDRSSRRNGNDAIIGNKGVEVLRQSCQKSKAAGKPWQIYAANSK